MACPFEITELRQLITTFLAKGELFCCILTCKKWHSYFIPTLYSNITLGAGVTIPNVDSITQNLVHVRSLTISDYLNHAYYSIGFKNLSSFSIIDPPAFGPITKYFLSSSEISCILVNSKDTLKSFSLTSDLWYDVEGTFFDALSRCTSLTYLNFQISTEEIVNLSIARKLFALIKRVPTIRLHFLDPCCVDGVIEKLVTLIQPSDIVDFGFFDSSQLDIVSLHIIGNSPNLRSVQWEAHSSFAGWRENEESKHMFRKYLSNILSKSFENLELRGYMMDDDLELMIRAMTDAKRLCFSNQSFGEKSYHALIDNHSNTITTMNIVRCSNVTSSIVQGILTKCPSLVSFKAIFILGADLVRVVPPTCGGSEEQEKIILGEDWVCLNLRELQLSFYISRAAVNIECSTFALSQKLRKLQLFHAFRQLSRLHLLHTLDISRGGKESLDLKLRSNGGELDQLCTLKRLRTFRPYLSRLDVGEEEKVWMKKYWNLDDSSSR